MPSPLDILNELEAGSAISAPAPKADPARARQFFSSTPFDLDLGKPAPGASAIGGGAPGDIRALFADLERVEAENPALSAQFFGDTPLDLGPKTPPVDEVVGDAGGDLSTLLTDLDIAQEENPDLAAQFFGDTPLDLGPKTPPVDEPAGEGEAIVAALDDLDVQKDPAKFFSEAPLDLGAKKDDAQDAAAGELVDAIDGAVGEVSAANPVFKEYVRTRAAKASNQLMQPTTVSDKRLRDYMMDFGPMWMPAGEQIILTATPQCAFKGLKIMATDTSPDPGTGTLITLIQVGALLQRPANTVSLTKFFAQNALGNGISFDTAQPTIDIAVTVQFMKSCTFMMTLFGTARMPEPDDAQEILT